MVCHIQEPLFGDDNYLLVMDQEEMLPSLSSEIYMVMTVWIESFYS